MCRCLKLDVSSSTWRVATGCESFIGWPTNSRLDDETLSSKQEFHRSTDETLAMRGEGPDISRLSG
jgi:hypothetical protein